MFVSVINSKSLAPIFKHPIWLMLIVTLVTIALIALIDKKPAFFRTQEFKKKYGSLFEVGTKEYIKEMQDVTIIKS